MKKILFIIAIFISAIAYSQPQTIYKVASIAAMKAYFGAAQRIHVTATNQDFIYCPGCTPDEITIFDGVGARNWKLTPDIDTVDVDYPLQPNGTGGLKLSTSFIDSFQVKDADLTTLAGLTATTNNFLVSVSSAWASRTPAQAKTTLALDNVDNTSDVNKPVSTAQQTAIDLKGTNYAQLTYALLGGTIKAEPLAGNVTNITVELGMSDQQARWTVVYLPKAATITGVKWFQSVAGAYTADNYNGVGLYSISGGTLTLVASSTDDGNIWKATSNALASKSFSSTYAAAAGAYVIVFLYSQSAETTNPTLGGFPNEFIQQQSSSDFTNSAKLNGYIAGLTALPSSQAWTGITSYHQQFYLALY